jgi:undecaprenyl diphosphate synthase
MRLLVQHLKTMDKKCLANGVALVAQGSLERLPKFVQKELKRVMEVTAVPKPKLFLNLALSYGGRQEIADAARKIAERVKAGEISPEQVDEAFFQKHLYHPEFPDPDLLIRTGGEYRVSNFLLWEIAYSEIVVTKTLWPDFNALELQACLDTFRSRQRRFGKTGEQLRDKTSEARPTA